MIIVIRQLFLSLLWKYLQYTEFFFLYLGNVGVFKDDKRPEKTYNDPVSMAIGEFGRWQAMLTLILSLLNLPCTWHIFVLTFQGADSDFWCSPPPGLLDRISVDQWKNISGEFIVSSANVSIKTNIVICWINIIIKW